ncbi:PREDICTED: 28S ribosomal protein S26, mitochondrial [Mandrillus leucophaeus]|uniref:28S ribosomal protein S26, mitochondrial n=1 Tax=Mandrillus leucophaeus TaxID=9568 RepID=UPI0005F3C2C4|nr:PREDICTED: 28S ribosomal protein S26, mitochondrial [Mandrillus leucophaeus]
MAPGPGGRAGPEPGGWVRTSAGSPLGFQRPHGRARCEGQPEDYRIARLRQEEREQEQRQALEQARKAEEMQASVQRKEREVLQLQEEVKNFITRENLEARVEAALDSPKNYNWAITREGLVVRSQRRDS